MRRLTGRSSALLSPDTATAQPGNRSSIAGRLRWSFLISSTLPLLIVGALLLRINADAQQENVYTAQRNLSVRTSDNIGNYIQGIINDLKQFGVNLRPNNFNQALWDGLAVKLSEQRYPDIVTVAVIDRDGKELVRIKNLQPVPESERRNVAAEEDVQRVLSGFPAAFRPIQIGTNAARTFMLTIPLLNDAGILFGALRAEVNADPIAKELVRAGQSTPNTVYLVRTSDGVLLEADTRDRTAASQQVDLLLDSPNNVREYMGANNESVVGAYAHVALADPESAPGWTVVVEQPTAVAFVSVRSSVPVLAGLIVLVGALALLWAFRQSQSFLLPLAELRQGALALGEGRLDYRIGVSGDDEMGDLARAFNQTAGHLQASLEEIERQNERLRHGLALARDIQLGLLPDRVPWSAESIDVYARSLPAYEVGGDFYTYLALSEGRGAIAIGDISGKGVGAALLMALTSSAVESQGRQIEHPAQVLKALNQVLAPRLRANHMNAALLFAVIDPPNRMMRVANAGMIAPVLITAAGSQFIDVGGLPVGSFIGATYQEEVVALNPGDTLLLVSDGVVEAHNDQGELFGFERLEAAIAEVHPLEDVRTLVEVVLARVQAFMSNTEQHDDITLVAIRPAVSLEINTLQTQGEEQTTSYATV
ncbi:MAG TPA: SpoIIE family protein phosphatase [Roseiflexaceae bacterium]|nr:SpoIIE family protein phosphatase [Roseiflexaceae bacterium]